MSSSSPMGRWQTSSGITFNGIWDSDTLLPIDGNTETYLQSDRGRRTLERVGTEVIRAWHDEGVLFEGDVQDIRRHVDHFLSRIRDNFPTVTLARGIRNPDNLAQTVRNDVGPPPYNWDGNLWDYKPALATGFYFNLGRVQAMTQNFASPTLPQQQARERDVTFQFLFGMATCHELVHAQSIMSRGGDRLLPRGESGRVFDLLMYGGTIEFYRDPSRGEDQPGVPYLLDASGLARKITRASIEAQILNPEDAAVYPLQTHPEAFDAAARIHRELRSMGAGLPPDSPGGGGGGGGGRFMTAAAERYYVSDADARLVVSNHRKVQPVTVGSSAATKTPDRAASPPKRRRFDQGGSSAPVDEDEADDPLSPLDPWHTDQTLRPRRTGGPALRHIRETHGGLFASSPAASNPSPSRCNPSPICPDPK
ncbi:hypothetical protein MAPG_10486 [Magnaporthiopsis poae ATCC 64411]|uniref:Uncharacterized protein n=1 Tax=Magnaporthiopsis poae (strain ATCC 64411 / 73-15) TaxID=644358 RepID=A0A0C4ECQ4_MAGP6|nr:hypothetical protein MAPG_10486 [Magnaporthiopsis poae ATCC 64411]